MNARWVIEAPGHGQIAVLAGTMKRSAVRAIARQLATRLRVAVTVKRISASSSSSRATPRRKKPRRAARVSSSSRRRSSSPKRRKAAKKGSAKRGKSRGRRRAKRNPAATALLNQAERTFGMWHGFGPSSIRHMKARSVPRVLVLLGELHDVTYRSDKWTGREELYRHTFKKPRPLLCTGPDAKGLFVLGGRAKVTDRGLVD